VTGRLALGISVLWIPLAFLFDGVTVLLLPVKVGSGTDPASTIGLISFAGLGAALLVQPIAGLITDRLRRRLDRRSFAVLIVLPIIAGMWLFAGATAVLVVAAAYLVVQVSASALQSVQQTWIPEHVDPSVRGRAAGLKTAFDLGGAFLAFGSLGVLLAAGDAVPAVVAITVLLIVSLVVVVLLVPATRGDAMGPAPGIAPTSLPTGFRRLVLARFLFLLGTYGIGRFLLLISADRMGIDPARAADETGGLLALFTLVGAVAAVPFGAIADRLGRVPVMRLGILLSAVGIAAFLPAAGVWGILIGGTTMSLGTAAFVTANWAATTRLVPPERSGRLMAIANFGTGGAAACVGLLGPLIDWGGFTPAILLGTIATLAALAPLTRIAPIRIANQPI
jgi:MFS family permease